MNFSDMPETFTFAVLSFAAGLLWGITLSSRGWRKAKRLINAMHHCTGAMAVEILRLRDLVSSLGGDPGPTPTIVVRRMEGDAHDE